MNVELRASPSFSKPARDPVEVDMLVIHYTGSRNPSSAINAITNPHHKASYNFMIHPDGEKITCFVPPLFKAWHAGRSIFQGRKWCNGRSIGISFVNDGEYDYSAGDLNALRSLLFKGFKVTVPEGTPLGDYYGPQPPLLDTFPNITADTVATHQEIAEEAIAAGLRPSDNPRFDPGVRFPFSALIDEVYQYRRAKRLYDLRHMHEADAWVAGMRIPEEMLQVEDDSKTGWRKIFG